MRITDEMMQGIFAMVHAMGGSRAVCVQVEAVLSMGNDKHQNDYEFYVEHISHAMDHLAEDRIDEESGQPHWAHAVARLILAIAWIIRENK